MKAKNFGVYALVVLAMFFWSMTYIWYKAVFEQLEPITVMVVRLGFSAIFLFAFAKITRRLNKLEKTDYWWMFLLSFFQPFLYFLFESYGVNEVSPTVAAVIISTIPVFTPFIMYLFYGDKVSVFNVFGIIVSFFGVLAVVLGKNLHFSGSPLGIAYLFAAVAAALAYAVVIVRLTGKYSSLTIITWQNFFGTLFFIPLFFIFDWSSFQQVEITSKTWINLIYLALFGSSLAYVFFTMSIKNLGVTRATMFTNIIPVFTAIVSYFWLHEQFSLVKIGGIALVLLGLFMSQLKLTRAK